MSTSCTCEVDHPPRLVVVTGGPGAGKTAMLEVAQRQFCSHVVVLPEAASLLWKGGFPRRTSMPARKAAQRAIVRVQIEMQRIAIEEGFASLAICDRGTLDGLAYWPGRESDFFDDLETTRERELARYAAILHLRPPSHDHGYVSTDLRPETADEAARIDERIAAAWAGHPHQVVIDSDQDFLRKLHRALEVLRREVPGCCR